MKTRFFAVTAKCGHVGRQFYYEGTFNISALTKKEAAAIARSMPRVKRDHKDAILRVEEITVETFTAAQEAFKSEAYFHCNSKRKHNLFHDEIATKLRPETDLVHEYRKKKHNEKRVFEPRIKQHYKREKYILLEDDLDIFVA